MSNNDAKIKEMLAAIQLEKAALGERPKFVAKSNGIVVTDGQNINLHTHMSLDGCARCAAEIVKKTDALIRGAELLGLDPSEISLADDEDLIADLKLKAKIIKWTLRDKQIKTLEKKLKDLRSKDQKTEDALGEIANLLTSIAK